MTTTEKNEFAVLARVDQLRDGKRELQRAVGRAQQVLRLEAGLSGRALAERCGFDKSYPSLLEKGRRGITVWLFLIVAAGLNVTPERFLAETLKHLKQRG